MKVGMNIGVTWALGSVAVEIPDITIGEGVGKPKVGTMGRGVGWAGLKSLTIAIPPAHKARIPTTIPVIHNRFFGGPFLVFAIFLAIMDILSSGWQTGHYRINAIEKFYL